MTKVKDRKVLMFKSYDYDEEFDFKRGTLPTSMHFHLGDQLERAREILAGRSNEQIAYGLESLDWLLKQGSEMLLMDFFASDKEAQFMSRPKALKRMQPDIDLSQQRSFPEATWPEYFALLALLYVVEWLYVCKCPGVDRLPSSARTSEVPPMDYAVEAMDAVAYAECLSEGAKGRSARARKVRKFRAKKFDDLKAEVIAEYEAHHTHRSDAEAAKRIYKKLKEKVDKTLRTQDPEKQLAKWIGDHRRSINKS